MVSEILRHILRFVVLVAVQGLILKNVEPLPGLNPFLYVLFLLLLPVELPGWLGLLIAFVTGWCVDLFYGTPGMHTATCTFIGFIRPAVLRFLAPRDGYEFGNQPTMQDMGRAWFLTYAAVLVVAHHFVLFFLEMFTFREFFYTLLRILMSSVASLLLITVTQFLFYRTKSGTA
jgi:rod shape-determining protein MreD